MEKVLQTNVGVSGALFGMTEKHAVSDSQILVANVPFVHAHPIYRGLYIGNHREQMSHSATQSQ